MTDRKVLPDANEPPEDVASLYSWANLHGAKYRDFSAARAQNREKVRQRLLQSAEEEKQPQPQSPEPPRAPDAQPAIGHNQLAELASQLAAQLAAHQAAQQAAAPPPPYPPAPAPAAPTGPYSTPKDSFVPPGLYPRQQPAFPGHATTQSYRPASPIAPMREEPLPAVLPPDAWDQQETREVPSRPAWLTEKPGQAPAPAPSRTPDDTIQGSRDRLTARWFALKAIFEGPPPASAPESIQQAPVVSRLPVLAVFSLAGGVGKTSVVATLGRALSARGERVLLVDTSAFGLLPFFFGAHDQRLGQLRTFSPPPASGDSPIQLITFDPESLPSAGDQDALIAEITRNARGINRIVVDLATASGATARRILRLSPLVLVPVVPDMNSVVSVGSIDAFFEHAGGASAKTPYYVLNQFDASLPLHLDVREVLREQLGERLLPFALRRAPAVSEALAEGMTVMDYVPNSTVAEDFSSLAGWLKGLSAPASGGFRGVRWSER